MKGEYEFEEEYWGLVSDSGILEFTVSQRFYITASSCQPKQ
jgi:hypothetical protein